MPFGSLPKMQQRLPGVHGLRAIAALGIVVVHVRHVPKPLLAVPDGFSSVIWALWFGVPLFFVLSAFSLLYAHDRDPGTKGWVIDYFIKRLFRIAPLFWAMIVFYLYNPLYPQAASPQTLLANVFFYFNFVPPLYQSFVWAGWTIGVEMPFYLCLPLIISRVRRPLQALTVLIVAMMISVAARYILAQEPQFATGFARYAFASNLGIFAIGMFAYHAVTAWGNHPTLWRWVARASVILLALLPVGLYYLPRHVSHPDALFWSLPLGMLCAAQAVRPAGWLASTPMQWLGERSYSLYLLHPFVVYCLFDAGVYAAIYRGLQPVGAWAFFACVAATLAILVPAAGLTYRLIERPGQRLGQALIAWRRRARRPSTAATVP